MDIDKIIYFLKDFRKRTSADSAEAIDCAIEVVKIATPDLVLVEKLEDTERGNSGFGSTGR